MSFRVVGVPVFIMAVLCLVAEPCRALPRLHSDQDDVQLRIRGAVSLSGGTPLTLEDLPPGHYRFRAEGPGLARSRGRLDRLSGSGFVTRSWTDARSALLPPGITHLGAGESLRGILLLAGAGAAGVQAIRMDNAHADAVDAVEAAVVAYDRSVSGDEISRSTVNLLRLRDEEEDKKELRLLWTSYFAATWVGAAVEALLLTPNPSVQVASDGNYLITVPEAGGLKAGLRSMLVPGAGQRFLGRETKGNFFTASVLALGAGSLLAHESFLDARREQLAAQYAYDAVRSDEGVRSARRALNDAADEADDKNRLRWIFFGATLGAYVWNIVDAAVEGSRVAQAPPMRLSVVPTGDGMQAGLTWRLP